MAIGATGRLRANQPKYLYFIEATGLGEVKVGISVNPLKRANELKFARQHPMQLLGVSLGNDSLSGRSLEYWVHAFLRRDQVEGEWFSRTERLNRCLQALSTPPHVHDLPSNYALVLQAVHDGRTDILEIAKPVKSSSGRDGRSTRSPQIGVDLGELREAFEQVSIDRGEKRAQTMRVAVAHWLTSIGRWPVGGAS